MLYQIPLNLDKEQKDELKKGKKEVEELTK